MQKVLRQDWGFRGYVVSDCGGPSLLVNAHKYVKTKETAATLSIKAGLDLECGDDVYDEYLLNAYKQYMVSDADIDSAACHVLAARMKLGCLTVRNVIRMLGFLHRSLARKIISRSFGRCS